MVSLFYLFLAPWNHSVAFARRFLASRWRQGLCLLKSHQDARGATRQQVVGKVCCFIRVAFDTLGAPKPLRICTFLAPELALMAPKALKRLWMWCAAGGMTHFGGTKSAALSHADQLLAGVDEQGCWALVHASKEPF